MLVLVHGKGRLRSPLRDRYVTVITETVEDHVLGHVMHQKVQDCGLWRVGEECC